MSNAIYLVGGKTFRLCDCDPYKGDCPNGVKRALSTAELSRCLIPAPDVMTTAGLYPTCAELAHRNIALTEAAHDLLTACEMEQHNEDIFKGKWKKGSKGWSGDFVAKLKAEAMTAVKALTDPRKPARKLP